MRKLRILVFPCGSEIGLELHRSLRFVKEVELFGAAACLIMRNLFMKSIYAISHLLQNELLPSISEELQEEEQAKQLEKENEPLTPEEMLKTPFDYLDEEDI